MANPEHIALLCQGVPEWNNWRKSNPNIRPDFSGGTFLSEDLTGANLFDTDMSNADLTGSRLVGANLTLANLANTKLLEADLVGCNLSIAKPWKANIFWDAPGLKSSYDDKQLSNACTETVGELLAEIRKISQDYEYYNGEVPLYFRGESRITCEESKKEWELCPSIMRDEFLSEYEGRMLVDLSAKRPEEFNEVPSALAQWVLAQHHKLPTRFLDITRNPLVALFFACQENTEASGRLHVFAVPRELVKPFNSDTVSIISNFSRLTKDDQTLILGDEGFDNDKYVWFQPDRYLEAMGRLYQLIQQEKPYFAERIDPKNFYQVFIVEPQQSLQRIQAQAGSFLVSAFHSRFEREKILEVNPQIPVYDHITLTIPARCKASLKEELALVNITEESLFPGLDSSAMTVKRYYIDKIASGPPKYLLE